jgi:hypothetical protein
VKQLAGKRLCSACLAIPGIDFIADTRAKAWGKRDGWVWYFGLFGGFGTLAGAAGAVATGQWLALIVSAVAGVVFIAYFALQPWSRKALFGLIPLYLANSLADLDQQAAQNAELKPVLIGSVVGGMLVFTLFVIAAYRSPRNRLAFRLEVSDAEVARYYDSYLSNPSAKRALVYGLASLVIFPLIPVALVFGVLGWRRADPKAWPPRSGRGAVIAGLACAAVGALGWAAVIALIAST